MKRIKTLTVTIITLAAVCAAAFAAHAAGSYTVLYGFAFDVQNGGAVIHDYDERSSEVTLPNTLLGKNVIRIDDSAFFGKTRITDITLESAEHLSSIGSSAFCGCSALRSIDIPDSVESVGFGAFQDCVSLETASLGNGMMAIAAQTFYNCDSLKTVIVPDSVQTVGAYAFGGCESLRWVKIPDSVTQIGTGAFSGSDNAVICCYSGSGAHNYAVENGINYLLLDELKRGDVNADGFVNINDVTVIQRHLAELERINEIFNGAADANCDGKLDITDATAVQMYLAEYDITYPVGQPMGR